MENQEKFLSELREKTWEGELIISSLFVFSLYQVGQLFETNIMLSDLGIFAKFMRYSINVLNFGFIFHLIIRSVWLGFVGLSNHSTWENEGKENKFGIQHSFLLNNIKYFNELSVEVFSLAKCYIGAC